jgi:hypothetical protein
MATVGSGVHEIRVRDDSGASRLIYVAKFLESVDVLHAFQKKASPGWVYVYQQQGADHYELVSKIMTRPGSGTSLFVPELKRLYVASQAIGDQEASILAFEPVP